jgi:hypothetical protein
MKETFTKSDARHCKAVITVFPVFWNNYPTTYQARISYTDAGVKLFQEVTKIDRKIPTDAFEDAVSLLKENGDWF